MTTHLRSADVSDSSVHNPTTGVFTDGVSCPNPGHGYWKAVYVVDNAVVAQQSGYEAVATTNRMALTAVLAACRLVPLNHRAIIYSKSEYCVQVVKQWAPKWAAKNWKKHSGIKNVDLVRELYDRFSSHPGLQIQLPMRDHAHLLISGADEAASIHEPLAGLQWRSEVTAARYSQHIQLPSTGRPS